MAKHFKTDIGVLGRFVKTLERSISDLDEARSALSQVRADEVGTPRLDEACDSFQQRWNYGAKQLREMIDEVKDGVDANMLSYQRLEDHLEKSLKKMADESASSGGGKG